MRRRSGWARGTLVVVTQVENDLVQVLQGECLEDLFLTLRIVGDVAVWWSEYVTNFFMD